MKKALLLVVCAPLVVAAAAHAGQLIFRETETGYYVELTGELDRVAVPGRRPQQPEPARQEVAQAAPAARQEVAQAAPYGRQEAAAVAAKRGEQRPPAAAGQATGDVTRELLKQRREERLRARAEARAKARQRRGAGEEE